MDFIDFAGTEEIFRQLLAAACAIGFESVAGLMRQHVNICGGAIEVGEDERRIIFRDESAVSADRLVGLRFQFEQLVLDHEIKELACFTGKLPVHFLCTANHEIPVACRSGVPIGKRIAFIIIMELIHADARGLAAAQRNAGGHDMLHHLRAETGHILRIVIRAPHVQVAKRGEGIIAHGFCHFVPDMDELVVNLVQLCFVFHEEARPCFKGGFAYRAVRGLHILEQTVIVADLTVELDLAACRKRLIFAAQPVFLLHEGDECG